MTIPACQSIENNLNSLKKERAELQAELQTAPPNQKPVLAAQIKALTTQITQKQAALTQCEIINGAAPLAVVFSGTATLRTNHPDASGPFNAPITLGLKFNPERTAFDVTSFPPMQTAPFPTPLGTNITTISYTKLGKGSFNKAIGSLSLFVSLLFDHSVDFPIYSEDSDLSLVWTTGTAKSPTGAFIVSGSPLNTQTKAITIVGASQLQHGFLGGSDCSLKIAGTFSVLP